MTMNFHKIILTLLLALPSICFCQDKDDNESEGTTDVSKVTILNPGVSYEKRIGKLFTVYGQAFMNFTFAASYSTTFGGNVYVYFDPALTLQPRYYYNFKKMEEKGRRTEMNSMNYVCLFWQTVLSRAPISDSYYTQDNRRAINTIALCWGLQRNLPKRFSVDLNIGPGYLFAKSITLDGGAQRITKNAGQFTLAGQLNIGFWLNKRK
jgi:hypothetical protein